MTPRISVVIPSYNAKKWIRQTVDSVLCQTYPDFELIIVDDGSTDGTVDMVNSISDPRIRAYRYPNAGVRGPAAGRNRGLSHARGEFVAFLDHDDLWLPEKLAAQLSVLQENPEVALAYSWVDVIDEKGLRNGPASQTIVNGDAFDVLLKDCVPWTGSNPLIRRSAFQHVGLFSEGVGLADDWDMWLRIAEVYPFACIPKTHVLWRAYHSSTSANASSLLNSNLAVLNRAFARNPQLSSEQRSVALVSLYEGVISHSARGNPTHANSQIIIDSTITALRARPYFLYDVWRKPWLLRAILKAATILIMGEKAGQAIFERTRKVALR